jgi:hypothetical protein
LSASIVFVLMSAVQKAATVDQLARALAPHTVLVHHDFAQTPTFPLTAANVQFVPSPGRTGWASFGFVEGIFHSLRHAVENLDFDYLQLLSPTCLPIKPLERFVAHASGREEAHFGYVDLLSDPDALMSVGYRAFTPVGTLRHRAVGWLTRRHFGTGSGRRDEAGIWLRSGHAVDRRGRITATARLARWTIRALSHPSIGRHVFDRREFRPTFGSVWFGARRGLVGRIVEDFGRDEVRSYFSTVGMAEELLIPTLLRRHATRSGPLNHYIQRFDEARPGWIGDADYPALARSSAFFARKFPDDPATRIRTRVLGELVGIDVPNASSSDRADAGGPVRVDATLTKGAACRS